MLLFLLIGFEKIWRNEKCIPNKSSCCRRLKCSLSKDDIAVQYLQ